MELLAAACTIQDLKAEVIALKEENEDTLVR